MKKLKYITICASVLVLMLGYQNCSNSMTPMNLDEQSLDSLSAGQLEARALNLLGNKCSQCHNSTFAGGGIDYITDVNLLKYYRVVIPAEPLLSPLYTVLNVHEDHMSLLTQPETDVLFNWINSGMVNTGGSGVTPPGTQPLTPTWASISSRILAPRCNGCHNATHPRGLNYTSYATFMASNVITVNNANASLIITAVTRVVDRMPRNGPALSADEVQALRDWINAGAQNN